MDLFSHQWPLIEQRLSYTFQNKELLKQAFVHRSFFNENRDKVEMHNERLEFLGDSVLEIIVSNCLYALLPNSPEGDLSMLRSQITCASCCAAFLHKLSLGQYVLLGRGEKMQEGRGKETIMADLFEAILGAIFLDGGIAAAERFFFLHFLEDIQSTLLEPRSNWKAELQDYVQKKYQKQPFYKIVEESGPDHCKKFIIAVMINEEQMGLGEGPSKKLAEQAAAESALRKKNGEGKSSLEL